MNQGGIEFCTMAKPEVRTSTTNTKPTAALATTMLGQTQAVLGVNENRTRDVGKQIDVLGIKASKGHFHGDRGLLFTNAQWALQRADLEYNGVTPAHLRRDVREQLVHTMTCMTCPPPSKVKNPRTPTTSPMYLNTDDTDIDVAVIMATNVKKYPGCLRERGWGEVG